MGLFFNLLLLNMYIFLIGLVLKLSGGWRMIIYLFYFFFFGINVFIDF